jgi:PAS domain S-box-containing protein
MRILLADNSRFFVEVLSEGLRQRGHEVTAALDGLEALERLHADRPDVCIFDLVMPKMGGDRLCQYVKGDAALRSIPVILVSGMALEMAREAPAIGADALVPKGPIAPLIETIAELVARLTDRATGQAPVRVAAEGLHSREIVAELLGEKRRFERILESLDEGIVEVDVTGRVLFLNGAAGRILDVKARDVVGRPITRLFDGEVDELFQAFERVARARGSGAEEAALERNGRRLAVQLRGMTEQDGTRWLLLVVRDVSALAQRERLRVLGTMASNMAHGLKNFLASILGRTDLLRARIEDHGLRRELDLIMAASRDAATTVARLLEFASVRPLAEPARVNLTELVEDVLALTRPLWHPRASDPPLHRVAADLPPACEVQGVAADLREALANLVLNALEAMPEGGQLRLRVGEAPDGVFVEVADTGCGMSGEVRRRAFEPFFTTKAKGGTGLGLTTSNGIVRRHGGRIELASEEGRGTVARVYLPRAEAAADADQTPAAGVSPGPGGRRRAVLLVEEAAAERAAIASALRREGYMVVDVENGFQGLATFGTLEFDAVVADLSLGGLSGWEFARWVKARNPAVAVTLLADPAAGIDEAQVREAGIDGILRKPCGPEAVSSSLNALLERGAE